MVYFLKSTMSYPPLTSIRFDWKSHKFIPFSIGEPNFFKIMHENASQWILGSWDPAFGNTQYTLNRPSKMKRFNWLRFGHGQVCPCARSLLAQIKWRRVRLVMAVIAWYSHVYLTCDKSSSHLLAMGPYGPWSCYTQLQPSPIQYSKFTQIIITIDVPKFAFDGNVYGIVSVICVIAEWCGKSPFTWDLLYQDSTFTLPLLQRELLRTEWVFVELYLNHS